MDAGEPLPKVDVLVVPGTGSVEFEPLLSALQRVKFSGPLCLVSVIVVSVSIQYLPAIVYPIVRVCVW